MGIWKHCGAAIVIGGLALVSPAFGATPKATLTVAITGQGTVSSKPAGISCPSACKLHGRKGAKVTLTASPEGDAEFSHWSAPCGSTFKCTVKMSGAKVVHAFFKTSTPATGATPLAKLGHYVGTYSDGTFFNFDVQQPFAGSSRYVLTNLRFAFNGQCSNGGTLTAQEIDVTGNFQVQADESVSGHIPLTSSNETGSADFTGAMNPSGSGGGNLSVSVTFTNGPTCTSSGTWTAQDQG